jgi:serine/threonine protein kinase
VLSRSPSIWHTHSLTHTHPHHRSNVLLDSDGTCKLIGIGRDPFRRSRSDIYRWLAPETLAQRLYSCEGDVWSLAVTMWEVFTFGATPHYGRECCVICVSSVCLSSVLSLA